MPSSNIYDVYGLSAPSEARANAQWRNRELALCAVCLEPSNPEYASSRVPEKMCMAAEGGCGILVEIMEACFLTKISHCRGINKFWRKG